MMEQTCNGILVPQLFVFTLVFVVIAVAYLERSRREKHRLELQKAILERVGSVKDLAEFLTTEQGERFLASPRPGAFPAAPSRAVVSSRRRRPADRRRVPDGRLHTPYFGLSDGTPPPALCSGFCC